MTETLQLTCYACGREAAGRFYLVSERLITDRPFVFCYRCGREARAASPGATKLLVVEATTVSIIEKGRMQGYHNLMR